jgi:hypothetical protein
MLCITGCRFEIYLLCWAAAKPPLAGRSITLSSRLAGPLPCANRCAGQLLQVSFVAAML